MAEPITILTAIGACGSLIAIIFDKMRASRCKHIMCCGMCECDRDIETEKT